MQEINVPNFDSSCTGFDDQRMTKFTNKMKQQMPSSNEFRKIFFACFGI